MHIIIITVSVCIGMYLIDQFLLWLERQGFLYYRHHKSKEGVLGNALMELQAYLNPSARHVIEVKQNTAKFKKGEADAPGDIYKK